MVVSDIFLESGICLTYYANNPSQTNEHTVILVLKICHNKSIIVGSHIAIIGRQYEMAILDLLTGLR